MFGLDEISFNVRVWFVKLCCGVCMEGVVIIGVFFGFSVVVGEI